MKITHMMPFEERYGLSIVSILVSISYEDQIYVSAAGVDFSNPMSNVTVYTERP